jgi:hypothetical protein
LKSFPPIFLNYSPAVKFFNLKKTALKDRAAARKKTANNSVSSILDEFFSAYALNKIGKATGFIKLKASKINGYHFVVGFLLSVLKGQITYNGWALQIGLLTKHPLSKQGLYDRLTAQATATAFA